MVGFQLRILGKERLPRDLRLMTGFPIIIANMKNRYKLHSFSSTSSNISSASYTPSTYISFTSFQVQMVVTAANTGGCWGEVPPTHMTPTPLQSNTPLFPLFQVRDYHQQSTRLPALPLHYQGYLRPAGARAQDGHQEPGDLIKLTQQFCLT